MSALRISHLRCEYLVAPTGIDERAPRLSWQIDCGGRRGARQCAYRIRVASTPERLAQDRCDRWDSGRICSAQSTHVVYAGIPLHSRDHCFWDVEAWDETGAGTRSAPSTWSMGLLEPSDWQARWIAIDPAIITRDPAATAPTLTDPGTPGLFRREFEVPAPVARATLYATARGVLDLRANGRAVTGDRFAPEWTDYDRRIHYRTYDVSGLIVGGTNCIAATLGDGWWSGFIGWQQTRARYGSLENSLMLQLEIEFADGDRLVVCTDERWKCNTGPILQSDLLMGETYDARREHTGWDQPSFDESAWLRARVVDAPRAALVAQRSEPVRVIETLEPREARAVAPDAVIHDLGQNITGVVRLQMSDLPPGTRVTLRHGERLEPDGTLHTANLRRARATDTYIARGAPSENYEPLFTFHGFQYVEVSTDRPLGPSGSIAVSGRVIHSAMASTGRFECSHPGVNRLWLNIHWSQRDNFLSVPTDCPQRDERLGWMGDAQVFIRTATCNMDVAAFFTKWMIDVEDAQTTEGIFPDVAPRIREDIRFVGLDDLCGAPGWADAGVIVPWTIWQVYGDTRIIERHWDAMVRWLDHLERTNPDGLRTRALHNNYGDWLCIPTDTSFRTHSPMKNLLATAIWADDAAKMASMARALGREAEVGRFRAMFEKVRAAFQREYVRSDGRLTVETQTAYLLALAFDLLPEHLRACATAHLVDNIQALGWHLSTGFIGISHLNPQLTLHGRNDVAYRLLLQETCPSWLFPVQQGATTIWERWDSWTIAGGFHTDGMNSFNHYSLGSVGEWLFRHVAGIELDPEAPGFQRFVLRPHIGPGLEHARATLRTMHGEIESAWHREGASLLWTIHVPANTRARVFIPGEADAPIESDGLAIVGRKGRFALCEAPAGRYVFRSSLRID